MIVAIITGVVLILTGLFVVKFPTMISGYRQLSKEDREKIDIQSVALVMRNILVGMGALLVLGSVLLRLADREKWMEVFVPVVVFGGVILLLIKTYPFQRFAARASQSNRIGIWLAVIITVVCVGTCFYVGSPAKIQVDSQQLHIKGAYSLDIPFEGIEGVEIREELPAIHGKLNGLAFMKYRKGHFAMDEFGASRLYLHTGKGPYLIIYRYDQETIVIDRSNPETLQELYKVVCIYQGGY